MQYDSTFEPFEANAASPCPVCGKGDWCYLKANAKGVIWWAVCGRAKESPEDWERTGTSKGSDRRGIYQIKGISHRRRKFAQDFELKPRKFEPGPSWTAINQDETFRRLSRGDVIAHEGQSLTIDKVDHAKSSGRWNVTFAPPNERTTIEAQILLAGGHEQVIEYHYGENHKVVRQQWSDRRPWYDRRGKTKQVRPWHMVRTDSGDRKWEIGRGPKDERWPIYREQEVLDAIAAGLPFYVVGGEACVEALRQLGFFATCCQGGEGRWLDIFEAIKEPLSEAFKSSQRKSTIILWPDNDPAGNSSLEDLHRRLTSELHARSCILNPYELWSKMPAGGDVVDWLAEAEKANPTDEQITEFLQAAADKAIDRAELAIAAQERAKDWGAPEVYRGEYGFWRWDKKEEEAIWAPQTNWTAQILQEIHGGDGGGFILGIKLADEQREFEVRVTAQDCESKTKFQRALSSGMGRPLVCRLKDEHIQALQMIWMLNYSQIQGGKSYKLCKQMGCQANNPDGSGVWVFPQLQLTATGELTKPDQSGFTWDESINDGGESVEAPRIVERNDKAISRLFQAAKVFFGDNFPRTLICMGWGAAVIHYSEIFKIDDAFPLLNAHGDAGGGKTESVKCGMALAGNHRSGMLADLSMSAVYEFLKISSNLPLCWDDPTESEDLNELLKKLYNAKGRVVRGDGKRFSKQKPHTSLAVSTNAAIGDDQQATKSRLSKLFFPPLKGGEQNTETFQALQQAMDEASGGMPDIIAAGIPKDRIKDITALITPHLSNAHSRLSRSWALFIAYGEIVQELAGDKSIDLVGFVIREICPELNTEEESGDSISDFLEKVAIMLSSSKAGPWNIRAITQRDGTEAIALYLPSLWEEAKGQFTMAYNRGTLTSLLNNRTGKASVAKLQIDKQSAQDYARTIAKVRAENGNVSLIPQPIFTSKKCHMVLREQAPELFETLTAYEKAGNSGNEGNDWAETSSSTALPQLPLLGNKNKKKVTEVTSGPEMDKQLNPVTSQKVTGDLKLPISVTGTEHTERGIQPIKNEVTPVTDLNTSNLISEKTALSTVTTPTFSKGDQVVINATARRYRKGSSPLPPKLPKVLKMAESALLVEIEASAPELFKQIQEPMEFLKLSSDGTKAQLLTPDGRKHAFDLADVLLFKKAEVMAHANG